MIVGQSQLAGGSRLSRTDQRPTDRASGAEKETFRHAESLRRLNRKADKRCGTDANISDEKTLGALRFRRGFPCNGGGLCHDGGPVAPERSSAW